MKETLIETTSINGLKHQRWTARRYNLLFATVILIPILSII